MFTARLSAYEVSQLSSEFFGSNSRYVQVDESQYEPLLVKEVLSLLLREVSFVRGLFYVKCTLPLTKGTENFVVIMTSNHLSLAMLYTQLLMLWASHIRGACIESASLCLLFCVCPGVFLIHCAVRDIFGSRLGHAIMWHLNSRCRPTSRFWWFWSSVCPVLGLGSPCPAGYTFCYLFFMLDAILVLLLPQCLRFFARCGSLTPLPLWSIVFASVLSRPSLRMARCRGFLLGHSGVFSRGFFLWWVSYCGCRSYHQVGVLSSCSQPLPIVFVISPLF